MAAFVPLSGLQTGLVFRRFACKRTGQFGSVESVRVNSFAYASLSYCSARCSTLVHRTAVRSSLRPLLGSVRIPPVVWLAQKKVSLLDLPFAPRRDSLQEGFTYSNDAPNVRSNFAAI